MILTADKLTKEFGGSTLFKNVSFTIANGDKIGIVGRNGCGKTTLLRVILDEERPTTGTISIQSGCTLGYLPQCPVILKGRTLWEFSLEIFEREIKMERELDRLANEMADGSIGTQKRYSDLLHEFELRDGYGYESRIRKVLSGLGFNDSQLHTQLSEFSGGWRTRVYLARLLLEESDVLILDEPTNHLDVAALSWLEKYLKSWKKALLIVSHDRAFLNSLCTGIWEIKDEDVQSYKGNYDQFQLLRTARYEERLKRWKAQQEHIERTEDFIRRHLAGQRTKEAQGRRTKLKRFLRDESIPKPTRDKGISIDFAEIERSGEQVLTSRQITIGYDGVPLIDIPSFNLRSRKILAILGPNGCGKSTLMKTLLGEIPPISGSFTFGAGVKTGYVSQTLDELSPSLNLVDAIREAQSHPDDATARNVLGRLGFGGDNVFKTIADLSGGERSRIALARLALRGANLLFLDEPTNHLDVESQELLQRVLTNYPGTLVFISHDRYLVRNLADQLLIFDDSGSVEFFDGTLNDHDLRKQSKTTTECKKKRVGESTDKNRRRDVFINDKRKKNELKRMQRRFDEIEKEILEIEERKKELEESIGMAGLASDLDKLKKLTDELASVEKTLKTSYTEWDILADALE